ncbi:hypothetical protein BS47DRAFT_1398666 [Hydnum rufescens UP504]|uniref:Uncharacterized protein n=1 Tax=Hydnum rufescens UP504 TaxID=1448309 RepID=A0A9P6AK95_9AGAM|nr:hypothetical protein BS47DRAFT_1398666 [Hydnum rufescens UP504]
MPGGPRPRSLSFDATYFGAFSSVVASWHRFKNFLEDWQRGKSLQSSMQIRPIGSFRRPGSILSNLRLANICGAPDEDRGYASRIRLDSEACEKTPYPLLLLFVIYPGGCTRSLPRRIEFTLRTLKILHVLYPISDYGTLEIVCPQSLTLAVCLTILDMVESLLQTYEVAALGTLCRLMGGGSHLSYIITRPHHR